MNASEIFWIALGTILAQILLAVFFFSSIVQWMEELLWDFQHRRMVVRRVVPLKNVSKCKYNFKPTESIYTLKADLYERKIKNDKRVPVISYYTNENQGFADEDVLLENRKIRRNMIDDEMLIKRQNFKAWCGERMVQKIQDPTTGKPTCTLRRRWEID